MEMAIAKMATEQKAADLGTAVGIAVLKMAKEADEAQALALIDALPDVSHPAPSAAGLGGAVDVSI
ncbi:MAG: YjfB family protein [Fibromonadaceae bacterium]|jgi:predicted O-methyltransferase YrrM|nr:YjfB family protein [Fibromonadaceae bacterium]